MIENDNKKQKEIYGGQDRYYGRDHIYAFRLHRKK